jgi:hypothetical protein
MAEPAEFVMKFVKVAQSVSRGVSYQAPFRRCVAGRTSVWRLEFEMAWEDERKRKIVLAFHTERDVLACRETRTLPNFQTKLSKINQAPFTYSHYLTTEGSPVETLTTNEGYPRWLPPPSSRQKPICVSKS